MKVPLVWCNGGSSQGLIALTLCQETLLQQKILREKERGIEKNFLSPSFDYRAEERKITEKGQKQREREIVGILIRLDEKGKKKKKKRKCKFCLQTFSIF